MPGLPLVHLPLGTAVLVDVLAWAVLSTLVGYLAHRAPAERFRADTPLTRLRSVEGGGRLYVRLGIRRWKDHLPEAGALFRGGVSKRALPGRSAEALGRFAAETRRAEWVHWVLLACGPTFLLWNPPLLGLAMVAYAAAANVPCIAVQRYNRARLVRLAEPAAGPRPRPTPNGDGDLPDPPPRTR